MSLRLFLQLSGRFCCSASPAILHRKSFAAIPSVSLVLLGARIAAFRCHTNRSVKLPSFRHFQDRYRTTNWEKWGKKNGHLFRKVCVFHVSRAVCIARFRYNATKFSRKSQRPGGAYRRKIYRKAFQPEFGAYRGFGRF